MATGPDDKPNVVNLAEARRRQRTVRAGAKSGKPGGAQGKPAGWRGNKIWGYLQFVVFLALCFYMLRLCQH